ATRFHLGDALLDALGLIVGPGVRRLRLLEDDLRAEAAGFERADGGRHGEPDDHERDVLGPALAFVLFFGGDAILVDRADELLDAFLLAGCGCAHRASLANILRSPAPTSWKILVDACSARRDSASNRRNAASRSWLPSFACSTARRMTEIV